MTIRHLSIFVTVCKHSSITAAAEELNTSQPSISQSIIQMEKYYNVKLFDRISNKLFLTEAGHKLLGYAKYIIDLFKEMEDSLRQEVQSPVIQIGSSVTIGSCLLPEYIKEYQKYHPDTTIKVKIISSRSIEDRILENSLDLGMVEGIIDSPLIHSIPFMSDELIVICGKDHPLASVDSIPLETISDLKFIMREKGGGSRDIFDAVMISHEQSYSIVWECNSTSAIKNALLHNIGVSVLSRRLVEQELADGTMHELKLEGVSLKRHFYLIHHKNKYISGSTKAFMELVLAQSKQVQT